MAECPSVCEHLHLPIQSGSDEMLQRMGRQYTVDHYRERLARIRDAVPGISISTDVIVGFCGESEAQFQATLNILDELRYDTVFAAAYSPRPGTPALRMADDVPAGVKRIRLNELLARQEGIGLARNREWLGREVEVLVERITPPKHSVAAVATDEATPDDDAALGVPSLYGAAGEGSVALAGRTRHNKLVHIAGAPALVGMRVKVHIDHAGPFALRGRVVEPPGEPNVIA
jgi:tRNA A37 methylthiotransferase MiaB